MAEPRSGSAAKAENVTNRALVDRQARQSKRAANDNAASFSRRLYRGSPLLVALTVLLLALWSVLK